jgi:predicted restriction endonuclease
MKGQDYSQKTLSDLRSLADFHGRIRQIGRKLFFQSSEAKHCAVCGYGKFIEICHIRPIQDFPEDTPISVVNDLRNLIALCPNCHWELDHGLLTLDGE